MKDSSGHAIYEIASSEKSLVPKPNGEGGVSEKSDAFFLEIAGETAILAAPIRLNCFNFCIEHAFNMFLEGVEGLFNIGFSFKEIDPCKTAIIVQKTHIIFKTTNGSSSRAPYIRMNNFKRCISDMIRISKR